MSIISNIGRGRATLAGAAAVVAAAAVPSAANAATVSVVGDHIEYRAAPGEVNQLDLGQSGTTYAISDRVANVFAGAGCAVVSPRRVHCSLNGVRFVSIELGDGNDSLDSIGDLPGFATPSVTQLLNGNAGNDQLIAGVGANVVVGAEGDDVLFGNTGNDNINGGAGNDTMLPGTGLDTVAGGIGRDRASYANHPGPVVVSVDGVANDGAAGESDNVATDVEELQGSSRNDTLIGNALANRFFGSLGDDTYLGGAGNDDYLALDDPGSDTFRGQDGTIDAVSYGGRTQSITVELDGIANDGGLREFDNILPDVESAAGGLGADRLIGSRGADRLFGSGGADVINPLAGADTVSAGAGDDRVFAKDGERDSVTCGTGADRVERDAGVDSVSATTCEARV